MPLPLPEQLMQTGANVPLPSQQAFLKARYAQLLTPDQLAPDLFTRIAQGLKPVPNPKAVGLDPLRSSEQTGGNRPVKPAATSQQPEQLPVEKPDTDKAPAQQQQAPKKQPEEGIDEQKPASPNVKSGSQTPQYLTRDQLMNWQNQLSSNIPTKRQKAAIGIFTYLDKHPDSKFNPVERRALAALVLNLLQDTDKVVRQWGLWAISEGHVQFTRTERFQSPYKELNNRISRMLKVQDPTYALAADERPLVESIHRNWKALTTLPPPPPPHTELAS
jgi:hypothetical protein